MLPLILFPYAFCDCAQIIGLRRRSLIRANYSPIKQLQIFMSSENLTYLNFACSEVATAITARIQM